MMDLRSFKGSVDGNRSDPSKKDEFWVREAETGCIEEMESNALHLVWWFEWLSVSQNQEDGFYCTYPLIERPRFRWVEKHGEEVYLLTETLTVMVGSGDCKEA